VGELIHPRIEITVGYLSEAIFGGNLERKLGGVTAQAVTHQQKLFHFRF
jgi:hypothetical protein